MAALRELDRQARALESRARGPSLEELFARERRRAPELGGRSVQRGRGPAPAAPPDAQLCLPGVTQVAREPDKR